MSFTTFCTSRQHYYTATQAAPVHSRRRALGADRNPYADAAAPYKVDHFQHQGGCRTAVEYAEDHHGPSQGSAGKEEKRHSLKQAVLNAAGVTLGTGEGGNAFGDRFFVRGFDTRNDVFIDKIATPASAREALPSPTAARKSATWWMKVCWYAVQTGHPPVLHLRMIAIRNVDAAPAACEAFILVVEILETVQFVQVPEHGRVLAIDLESVQRLLPARVARSSGTVPSEPLWKRARNKLASSMPTGSTYRFQWLPNVMAPLNAGGARALAVAGTSRLPALPDTPTTIEAGLPDYQASGWFAMQVPRGTPKDIVTRINREMAAALADPDVRKRFEQQGAVPNVLAPEQAAKFISSEIAKWRNVIVKAGIPKFSSVIIFLARCRRMRRT